MRAVRVAGLLDGSREVEEEEETVMRSSPGGTEPARDVIKLQLSSCENHGGGEGGQRIRAAR